MNDDEEILGLIDYLAVEWPGGHVTGEGFQLLLDLVDRNIVRVLDLEFITKAADGTVKKVALGDLEHGGDVDVTIWDDASSGLLDQSDIDQVAAVIEPGSLAGILVYENLWSVPLMTALDRSSARMVGNGRVIVEDLLIALDSPNPTRPLLTERRHVMGLIKTGLKAAVAVKVAHLVHDRIEQRKQAERAAGGHPDAMPAMGGQPGGMPSPAGAPHASAPAAAAPVASPPVSDTLAQLTQLGELKAAGVLTEDEFQIQKARILNG